MNQTEQKKAAKAFVKRWKNAEGDEDRESRSFWIELFQEVLGQQNPTHFLDFEKKVRGRKIDVFYEDMRVLIEMKSRGVDLDKKSERSKKIGAETPYQQAKWYSDNLPYSSKPKWIITSNFDEIRVYDTNEEKPENSYITIQLTELPDKLSSLAFLTDKSESRLVKESEISVSAAKIVSTLYDALAKQYRDIENDVDEQRGLNMLITRFVFLLYAEDAGLLQSHQALENFLKDIPPHKMRASLIELFKVLDTPETDRDPYLEKDLSDFPYINGGLFSDENIIIPQFTTDIKFVLLTQAARGFDWKDISPTIFGAAFESTINPETRRSGGMHYTSIENIHKVIDPLFLNDLKAELDQILGIKTEKNRRARLKAFQKKLASIKILDPACGSGNFLTESYMQIRRLENKVFESLQGDQGQFYVESATEQIEVSVTQFYGIEINDFAVSVAKTALWIAEQQMMDETQSILQQEFEFLPLTSLVNIHEGNALSLAWNSVLPAKECSFICGNPPFKGAHAKPPRTTEQTNELKTAFDNHKGIGEADYVAAWFAIAAKYMHEGAGPAGFVATSSIGQGQQPGLIWSYLIDLGMKIDFAYEPFLWKNEANDPAAVAVTIIGFSNIKRPTKTYFNTDFAEGNVTKIQEVRNINPFLRVGDTAIILPRTRPLCNSPKIGVGNKPIDGGFYLFNKSEMTDFLVREPGAEPYFHKWIGAEEFINGLERYVLWLGDAGTNDLTDLPLCRERIRKVQEYRLSSKSAPTRKLAECPTRFHVENIPETESILIPQTSSERRTYIPMGFIQKGEFCSNAVRIIPGASLYDFGVLQSLFHNAWMRVVTGRLEGRYQYAAKVVYNNFPWPGANKKNLSLPVSSIVDSESKREIESCAGQVLEARKGYSNYTLGELYDPNNEHLYPDLINAHEQLDKAVERAYGVDFGGDEEKIVAHLFKLYADVAGQV